MMKSWGKRAREIAYLLNPAFCGRMLYQAIREYHVKTNRPFPFPLIYLVLPLALHKETRQRIDSVTAMQVWIQRHPDLLIGFADRARDMVPFTNEALEFLMASGHILITTNGDLSVSPLAGRLSERKCSDPEIGDCLSKSSAVARWFARAGATETIYASWGVRP